MSGGSEGGAGGGSARYMVGVGEGVVRLSFECSKGGEGATKIEKVQTREMGVQIWGIL